VGYAIVVKVDVIKPQVITYAVEFCQTTAVVLILQHFFEMLRA